MRRALVASLTMVLVLGLIPSAQAALPSLRVRDTALTEATGTTRTAAFRIQLSRAVGRKVTVKYATVEGSATAPQDYVATSGTKTFMPGQTLRKVFVTVKGDSIDESTEKFHLRIFDPTRATIADRRGTATITDDDEPPDAAPTVESASASSETTVVVQFSEAVNSASVNADGSQFDFDNGLTASAAATNGASVTVTTGAQTMGQTYTVTVENTVTDLSGNPLSPSDDSASFTGYTPPANLMINEVNPAISGHDLIELHVTDGGALDGATVRHSSGLVATLPDITVATGDFIVIHIGSSLGETTEMTDKTQCTTGSCFAAAWDVAGSSTGLSATDNVLTINRASAILDGAAFSNQDGTSSSTFLSALAALQSASQWLPSNCGGVTCTDATTPTAQGVSTLWTGVGTTIGGNSVRRSSSGTDTNSAPDWVVGTSTWGAPN